jgi:hypothetical protein
MKPSLLRPAARSALLGALLGAAACSDEVAPTAHVRSATPDRLVPSDDALDDLVIDVEYTDGDGDLGGGSAEVHDCRAEGLRLDLPIPAIAPEGVIGEPIAGTLELHVSDVGALEAAAAPDVCRNLGAAEVGADAAVFCVVLIDAAGHRGDGDCTRSIAIGE